MTSSGHLIATSSSSRSEKRRWVHLKTMKTTAAIPASPPTMPPMIAQVLEEDPEAEPLLLGVEEGRARGL